MNTEYKNILNRVNEIYEMLIPIAKKLDCPYNGEKLTDEEAQIAVDNMGHLNDLSYNEMVRTYEANKILLNK